LGADLKSAPNRTGSLIDPGQHFGEPPTGDGGVRATAVRTAARFESAEPIWISPTMPML
jgi:hypothetical protein